MNKQLHYLIVYQHLNQMNFSLQKAKNKHIPEYNKQRCFLMVVAELNKTQRYAGLLSASLVVQRKIK